MSVAGILDANGKIPSNLLPNFLPNDLVAPVVIVAEAPATAGNPVIYVEGDAASAVGGSLALIPGSRTGAAAPDAGLTIVSQPTGVSVYVGTDGQATNNLSVAGASGLSRVNDPVYNPVQMFVDANPGSTTTNPEGINPAAPAETIRVITLGNTPTDYNYFKMFLDFNGDLTNSNAPDPRIRFYISNTSNGAYNAATSIVSYAMPTAFTPAGSGLLVLEDVPLVYEGVATSNQLYLNFTYAGSPGSVGSMAFATSITTDYALEASKVSQM
jgi:hypothetical protein